MSSALKISADTSDAKRSILDLSKTVKSVGSSKIAIFSNEDKRFIKKELNQEIGLMKDKLKSNQREIIKLVTEQKKMVKGSKDELTMRKKIIASYKTQNKLAKQLVQNQGAANQFGARGVAGQLGKSGVMGKFGRMGGALALGGIAASALGVGVGIQGAQQFAAGGRNRTRAAGLGINDRTGLTPESIAEAGMTTQQLLNRRTQATAISGRGAGGERDSLQSARFERSFGLEEGQMTNVMGGLRGAFGGQTNEAQQKLQASVMASGMEDAIGPYLETMTGLLSTMNENGLTNTDEMINAMGKLSANGDRTPEQLARTFQNVNNSIKGASGESSAFLQAAFARGGIGGDTIGGTRFAMETGGIAGLDQGKFSKLGFGGNELLGKMKKQGQFGGLGQRAGAVVGQFKKQAGLRGDQEFSDIKDPGQLFALTNLANSVFSTEGTGGLEALSQLDMVKSGKMSPEAFNKNLKDIQEGKNPQVERLNKINETLGAQTTILEDIKANLLESIGGVTIGTGIQLQRANVARVRASGEVAKAGAGGLESGLESLSDGLDYISKGKLGEDVYDAYDYVNSGKLKDDMASAFDGAKDYVASGGMWEDLKDTFKNAGSGVAASLSPEKMEELKAKNLKKAIKEGFVEANKVTPNSGTRIKNNIKIQTGDGKITNKTYE